MSCVAEDAAGLNAKRDIIHGIQLRFVMYNVMFVNLHASIIVKFMFAQSSLSTWMAVRVDMLGSPPSLRWIILWMKGNIGEIFPMVIIQRRS